MGQDALLLDDAFERTEEIVTYKVMNDKQQLQETIELLQFNDIPCFVEDTAGTFDPSFAYASQKEFRLKLYQGDFKKADRLLQSYAEEQLAAIDPDYYLFQFQEEELHEILVRADEWNELDVQLARKILADRGIVINQQELDELKQQRLEVLRQPDKGQTGMVIFGYLFALLGGFIGFIISLTLLFYKKTLPNGERVYVYNPSDRRHGKLMLVISVVVLVFTIAYRLTAGFKNV